MSTQANQILDADSKLIQEKRNQFWRFIYKRQKVWQKRVVELEKPPWTTDDIIRSNRFTNVYRELDPGTQYAIQNILELDASKENKIFNIMIYRLIGRSETHEFLGFQSISEFDADEFERRLKQRRDRDGETIFTGAYMVAGYSQMGSSDKVENIARLFDEISSSYHEDIIQILSSNSLKEAYEAIQSIPGFGKFLSYQVLVDLLYPVEAYNGSSLLPFNQNEWAKAGPGAQKGIKSLRAESELRYLNVMEWLYENQESEFERLDIDFPYIKDGCGKKKRLSLPNIQNCLCEFYKYDKIKQDNGRARRRFDPREGRSPQEIRDIYLSAPNITLE